MAATQFLSKATLLVLSVIAILSLHGAEAQNCTCDTNYVPGWGIAIVVEASILLLLGLLSTCLMPLLCKKSGCSYSK